MQNTHNDTIVAISTQIGISAISIVRLSGENALEIALKLTHATTLTPRYAHLKQIYNQKNNVIEKCIVLYFKAPHSFTGEDIVEFQCHGGILAPKSIVELCLSYGARLANAGEFSKRAILNEKLDLATSEAITRLITSQNTQSQEILGRILKGDLKNYIEKIRNDLVEILAHIEVIIDYAEEDLPQDLEQKIRAKFSQMLISLGQTYEHSLTFQNIIDGHRLAIIGKPNVGKSSILNKLLLKDRAIVSPIAGTTRDIIEESITINNQIIKIIDTAGIHTSSNEIEAIGIQKTREVVGDASIIIAVFDGSVSDENAEIVEILQNNREKIIICVVNKADKPQLFDTKIISEFENVAISTLDESVYKLRDLIATKVESSELNNQEVILSSTRQIECVKSCIGHIRLANENLAEFELSAHHINEALRALDLISKPFDNEEVLDSMFSTFCLGK